jgi:hypothetical protein
MYVSDETWQDVVNSYLGQSTGVILQPSLTDGVLWEIDQVFRRVRRNRVLLSMVNFQEQPEEYERLWLLIRQKHDISLPRTVPYIDRPSFVFFASSGQPVLQPVVYKPTPLWPLTGNAIDIVPTLGHYLQGLNGTTDPVAVPVSPVRFFGALLSLVVTIALVLFVSVGLPKLTEYLLSR